MTKVALTPNQARVVGARLRHLERQLVLVRHLMDGGGSGALSRRGPAPFTPEERARMGAMLAEADAVIGQLAEDLGLPNEEEDAAARIAGLMAMTWQSLGDLRAASLVRAGPVQAGLAEVLDPPVSRLTDLVLEMERLAAAARGEARPAAAPRSGDV